MLSKAHFPAYTSLGLMGMTWRADQISNEQAFAVMRAASASGATLWSTADFYGTTDPLAGIRLVGRYFKKYPHDAFNISVYVKGCIDPTTMQPDNSPEATRKSVESVRDALGGAKNVDIIFGPARVDPNVPIEDTMEELEELVDECKISGVGLSEVGPETIRRAHACMPLALVEVEFSLWSTEFLTNGVAATTKELDIPVLAYSPLGRGFFTGQLKSIQDIPAGDMRLSFDRFQPEVSQLPLFPALARDGVSFAYEPELT
ncbi:NADP-dependent oxidoreductase domain-containing protein [Xylariaceae sp. FL0255]|nr:NADP-dependent oxidoreductase domain-containing protein [Xylariaceae sp. FL0255]